MFRGRRHHQGPGRVSIPILLLGMQMMQAGFDRIPPVTLVTILGQVAIFLHLLPVRLPSLQAVCVSATSVWYYEDWQRLLTASFFHLDDWHLYYNMASFLWKGLTLERRLGSGYFAYMIAVFAILTNCVTVGLNMGAERLFDDASYLYRCAAGFSAVIFALKVVTTYMLPPGMTYIMGMIPVHSRIACWVELLVIQLLVPNASFTGHLAGILVGLLYVKGPLKYIMDIFLPRAPSYTYTRSSTGYRHENGGQRSQGQTLGGQGPRWNNPPQGHSPRYGGQGSTWGQGHRLGGENHGSSWGQGHRLGSEGQRSNRDWNNDDYSRGSSSNRPSNENRGFDAYSYTGGLTEEQQVAAAIRESLQNAGRADSTQSPSAPPPDGSTSQGTRQRLYPTPPYEVD